MMRKKTPMPTDARLRLAERRLQADESQRVRSLLLAVGTPGRENLIAWLWLARSTVRAAQRERVRARGRTTRKPRRSA